MMCVVVDVHNIGRYNQTITVCIRGPPLLFSSRLAFYDYYSISFYVMFQALTRLAVRNPLVLSNRIWGGRHMDAHLIIISLSLTDKFGA